MLELQGLSRRFGDHLAVDDVSFTVPEGRMVGFVGGNGAGKTTTMRMVMGVLRPSAGDVTWQGRPLTRQDRVGFGYMPEERGLYPKQKAREQLTYLGRLRGMTKEAARARTEELLERFGLGERMDSKLEELSLGNQQRAQIIASVLGDPQMLILDEPFSGLDPAAVDQMSELLREHTRQGVPVLFSSHQLDLVDRLCDEIVVLHQGRVVARGTSEDLRASAPLRYRLSASSDLSWVAEHPEVSVVSSEPGSVLLDPRDEHVAEQLLVEAVRRGGVSEFSRIIPTLSEIYREVAA